VFAAVMQGPLNKRAAQAQSSKILMNENLQFRLGTAVRELEDAMSRQPFSDLSHELFEALLVEFPDP